MKFVHMFSECDTDFLDELVTQTVAASIAGFSEWRSVSAPVVSFGFGWFVHTESKRLTLAPEGVRSNTMMIDAIGYDLGPARTSHLLWIWLCGFEWQSSVSAAVPNLLAC